MIFRLDDRLLFPDTALAEEDGLLAVGGDLSTGRLLLAYQNGIFPWYSEGQPIFWYSPHERFVLYPHDLKISKSMKRVLRSGLFSVTFDTCFAKVIEACSVAKREGQDGTWITDDMKAAYTEMHRLGHTRSVEVWQNGKLVGGLYGVRVNSVFCGESMFALVSNASKVALISLINTTKYHFIDCQVHTEHLESMGARFISREEYMGILHKTIA